LSSYIQNTNPTLCPVTYSIVDDADGVIDSPYIKIADDKIVVD